MPTLLRAAVLLLVLALCLLAPAPVSAQDDTGDLGGVLAGLLAWMGERAGEVLAGSCLAGGTGWGATCPAPERPVAVTRVRMASKGIDLPVILVDARIPHQGPPGFPPCDVAVHLPAFSRPGEIGATYLSAHARTGMFLPLLEASWRDDGRELLGRVVEVWTSDKVRHRYRVTRVERGVEDWDLATSVGPGQERLILQTSETTSDDGSKLQLLAEPVGSNRATTAEARPRAKPRACYP